MRASIDTDTERGGELHRRSAAVTLTHAYMKRDSVSI